MIILFQNWHGRVREGGRRAKNFNFDHVCIYTNNLMKINELLYVVECLCSIKLQFLSICAHHISHPYIH